MSRPVISAITLGVADLDRALAFYRDGLGWPVAGQSRGVAWLDTGGTRLALFPAAELAAYGRVSAGSGGILLSHNVATAEAVDALLARTRHAGGRILRAAGTMEWGGRAGFFSDPDGHAWEVVWNPRWREQ
jgi:catechol 2,3-dioxygenase-like lactoylglutathione lyase family enzyme